MKSTKRVLSALLALIMLISLLPASALAAAAYTPSTCPHAREHEQARIDPSYYDGVLNYTDYLSLAGETEPTCTAPGSYTVRCNLCGFTVTIPQSGVPALGHSFGSWSTQKQSTCAVEGTETRTCERCGLTERRSLDRLPHSWGEWNVTALETDSTPGRQSRSCRVCGTTENIESFGITVQEGDSSLVVYILQALLSDNGAYHGKQDGCFTAELTRSVKEYQLSNDLEPTGVAHGVLFQLLTDDLLYREKPCTFDGLIKTWDSGLGAFAVSTGEAVSLEDGTHDVTYTLNGVRYMMDTSLTFSASSYAKTFSVGIESCHLANDAYTCEVCGYKGEVPLFPALTPAAGGWSLLNLPVDEYALPAISHIQLSSNLSFIMWDIFDGADSYRLTIIREDANEITTLRDTTTEVRFYDLTLTGELYSQLHNSPQAVYSFTITALKDGKEISRPTSVATVGGSRLRAVTDIKYESGTLSWVSAVPLPTGCEYLVTAYSASGNYLSSVYVQGTVMDINTLGWYSWFMGGEFYVEIQARPVGESIPYSASEVTRSEIFVYDRINYYRVNVPCNVRSGPGTGYERVGGLSAGTIITALSADEFLEIEYNGERAYVLATCCTVYAPVFYGVTVNPAVNGVEPRTYLTASDGTLYPEVFEELKEIYGCLYVGNIIYNWATGSEASTDYVDSSTVFTEDTEIHACWTDDPNYVYTYLYDYDGNLYDSFYAKRDSLYQEHLPGKINDNLVAWYTEEGEEVVLFSRIPKDDRLTLHLHAKITGETEYTLVKAVALFDGSGSKANILDILPEGTVVTIEDYIVNGDYPYRVRVNSTGQHGYLRACDIFNYTVTLTFDANGGWVDVASTVLDAQWSIKGSELPFPVKEGCTFLGWKVESNGKMIYNTALKNYTFYTGENLIAQWAIGDSTPMIYSEAWNYHGPRLMYVLETNAETGKSYVMDYQGKLMWVETEYLRDYYRAHLAAETSGIKADLCVGRWDNLVVVEDLVENADGERVFGCYTYEPVYVLGDYKSFVSIAYDTYLSSFGNKPAYYGSVYRSEHKGLVIENGYATLRLDPMGGSMPASQRNYTYGSGSTISYLPFPQKSGCTFTGWFTDPIEGERVNVGDVIRKNTRLYAHYSGENAGYYAVVTPTAACKDDTLTENAMELAPGTIVTGTLITASSGRQVLYVHSNGHYYYLDPDDVTTAVRMTAYRLRSSNGWIFSIKYSQIWEHYERFASPCCSANFWVVGEIHMYAGTQNPNFHAYKVVYPGSETGFAYIAVDENHWWES